MAKYNLKLLDCTLRDGGYINNWEWGFHKTKEIIKLLVKAGIDIVEIGFLRNVKNWNPDVTVCNYIEELNKLLPDGLGNTMFSAMAMRSNYDINKLSPYSGNGIEMIRITAHDYDIDKGMEFAEEVKEKGYKLSINPINIMGYSDERILWILKKVNEIQPYQFSIVDTFGSMKRRDMDRIVSLVDNNLDKSIRVALHLHENMSLSCCLAQNFIDLHLNRPVSVDASLMGMGRSPGNLPIELIADYLNDYRGCRYDIDYLMDAIQDYIAPVKGESGWGYTPAYFLSAKFNLHRNYAEHYLKKGDLTNRDINHILACFDNEKKTVFDIEYADELYVKYKNNVIQDELARERLKKLLKNKKILVMAPGMSIIKCEPTIWNFINKENPLMISVNFIPETYHIDYAFFSSSKRFSQAEINNCKVIATSNLKGKEIDFSINYNSLSSAFEQGNNSLVMLLKLLECLQIKKVFIAGADGHMKKNADYYDNRMHNSRVWDNKYNMAVANAIRNINITVRFLTPSAYEDLLQGAE